MLTITADILDSSPGGIHAKFVDLGEFGMKIYRDECARNVQFNNQTYLHDLELSVKCWDCFEFDGPDGKTLYAFYTEKCEVYSRDKANEMSDSERTAYFDEWQGYANKLCRELDDWGMNWTDDHYGNVGKDKNGKLVLIDCDFLCDAPAEVQFMGCNGLTW